LNFQTLRKYHLVPSQFLHRKVTKAKRNFVTLFFCTVSFSNALKEHFDIYFCENEKSIFVSILLPGSELPISLDNAGLALPADLCGFYQLPVQKKEHRQHYEAGVSTSGCVECWNPTKNFHL
jgi:hypothetical protein